MQDSYLQFWRSPRRRKILILALVALFLSIILFIQEFVPWKGFTYDWTPTTNAAYPPARPGTPTTSIPSVTETVTVYHSVVVAPKADPVVFVLIMWSESAAEEGLLLLKASFYTSFFLWNCS